MALTQNSIVLKKNSIEIKRTYVVQLKNSVVLKKNRL